MGSAFDRLQKTVFDTAARLFGETAASWQPKGGGPVQTATVLFNAPSEKYRLNAIDYNPNHYTAEYYTGAFPGLKDSADAGEVETLTISGQAYSVLAVEAVHDGKTYRATLEIQS